MRGAELRLWKGEEAKGEPAGASACRRCAPDGRRPAARLRARARRPGRPDLRPLRLQARGRPRRPARDETDLTGRRNQAGGRWRRATTLLEVRAPAAPAKPAAAALAHPDRPADVPVPLERALQRPGHQQRPARLLLPRPELVGRGPRSSRSTRACRSASTCSRSSAPTRSSGAARSTCRPTALYRFGTASRDGSWLYLDERLLVDNSRGTGDYAEGGAQPDPGLPRHPDPLPRPDRPHVHQRLLDAARPGREPLPTELLFPPQGSYPDKVVCRRRRGRPSAAAGRAARRRRRGRPRRRSQGRPGQAGRGRGRGVAGRRAARRARRRR